MCINSLISKETCKVIIRCTVIPLLLKGPYHQWPPSYLPKQYVNPLYDNKQVHKTLRVPFKMVGGINSINFLGEIF